MWNWKNRPLFAGILALCTIFLVLLITSLPGFHLMQVQLTDLLYKTSEPSKEIIIVTLDDKSISPEGLGSFKNWNRSYFAKVLENINKYQPKAVAFDIFFQSKKDNEEDMHFQNALKQAQNPFLIYILNPINFSGDYYEDIAESKGVIKLFSELPNVVITAANVMFDKDGAVRRIMPFISKEADDTYYENMAFAIARKVLNANPKPKEPYLKDQKYSFEFPDGKKLEIPLEQGEMIINFSTKPSKTRFSHISFVDVYNENYQLENPEDLFKNKIVLIGPTSESLKDNFPTGIDKKTPMPGIEIHANTLQTILEQKFLRNMSATEKFMLIFVLCFVSAYFFMYTKIRWSVVYLFAVPTVYTLLAPFMFERGIILDLINPYLTLVAVFLAIYIYRYLTEFKEKSILQGAFAKYVNPEIINQIMAHPESLKLGGDRREISVLFSDIVHFTNISEGLKPESLITFLNEYFQAMSKVILDEGGTLDKFEGDAIMAFFGAPLPQPDHALRACRAAIKMRYKLHELLAEWENKEPLPGGEKWPMIDFRCGINTGEAIAGNVGSMERLEYTVIGDTVNLGSRLEGANKKYQTHIMISQNTHEKVKDLFETRELDYIRVVGKKQPIRVYELLTFKGELPEKSLQLLTLYNQGMQLYHERKYAEALAKFDEILRVYPTDGPALLYRQRCEVLKDYPPREGWDGVFVMESK